MTAISTTGASLGLVGQLRSAAVETWSELPRVIATSAILVAAASPAGLAIIGGAPAWLVAISLIPFSLLLTGLAGIGAALARGERARVRELFRIDPVLGFGALAAGFAALWASAHDGVIQVIGFALSAIWLMVVPRALSYGAVRGRRGRAALRGGAILAVYRPGATITLLGLGVIGGFAVAASLGVFVLIVPALLATYAARVTAGELDAIDTAHGVTR